MQELHCMLGRHTELLRIWHSNNTTTSISDLECYSKVGLEDLPLFSCRQNGVFFLSPYLWRFLIYCFKSNGKLVN